MADLCETSGSFSSTQDRHKENWCRKKI